MAVGAGKRAAAVEVRARPVQPGLPGDMRIRLPVAVMAALRPVTVDTVQFVTGVTDWTIHFELIMGGSTVGPAGGGFAPGGVKVTFHALGAEIMAAGTGKRAAAVEIRARPVKPGLPGDMEARQAVTVMAGLGPVSINAV